MKVPVFLEATMELLAVVQVSDANLQNIATHGGYLSFHKWEAATTLLMNSSFDPDQQMVERIDLQAVSIGRGSVRSFYLLAKRPDHVQVLQQQGRQLWPRARKDKFKRTKAERKQRREFEGPGYRP